MRLVYIRKEADGSYYSIRYEDGHVYDWAHSLAEARALRDVVADGDSAYATLKVLQEVV